jgi:hypothetical protein
MEINAKVKSSRLRYAITLTIDTISQIIVLFYRNIFDLYGIVIVITRFLPIFHLCKKYLINFSVVQNNNLYFMLIFVTT